MVIVMDRKVIQSVIWQRER